MPLFAADANDAEKAYSLLLRMQEQDEIPSDKFLVTLADLLRKNGREVPFQVPGSSSFQNSCFQYHFETFFQFYSGFLP